MRDHDRYFISYIWSTVIVVVLLYFLYEAWLFMTSAIPWLVPALGVTLALTITGCLIFLFVSHAHGYHVILHRPFHEPPGAKKTAVRKALPPMRKPSFIDSITSFFRARDASFSEKLEQDMVIK